MALWRVRPIDAADEGLAFAMARELGLRQLTARVLAGRGVLSTAVASRFLTPRLCDLRAPDGIADLDRALDRLLSAIAAAELIGVFGDYDVDGVTTAAVLTLALRGLGARVVCRVASRSSGYGL